MNNQHLSAAGSGTHGVQTLENGRRIAYIIYGDPSLQHPVFYLHGVPGNGHEAQLGHAIAMELGISLIAVDRPGFGDSTFNPKRSILDTPGDIRQLADGLRIKRFGIIGVSGGGPHAAACALLLQDRLTSVNIVSSPAPFEAFQTGTLLRLQGYVRFLSVRSKALNRLFLGMFAKHIGRSTLLAKALKARAPSADQSLMAREDVMTVLQANWGTISQHEEALSQELSLLTNAWGFQLADITADVHVWHGKADETVPFAMGKYLTKHIPGAKPHFFPNMGHLLILHKLPEILRSMVPKLI